MNGNNGYAVFFYPQALEALGEAIKPYLQESDAGAHVLCNEIDTGGAFIELTMRGENDSGEELTLELMVPSSMVRMVVSTHSAGMFGFNAGALDMPIKALPAVGPTAQPAAAASSEMPGTATPAAMTPAPQPATPPGKT